MQQLIWY